MFENQPTNPQIVEQILSLSEGWKALLATDEQAKPKKKRAPARRSTKAKS